MATVEQVFEVLRRHQAKPIYSPYCTCGWRPGLMLNDTESDRQQHVAHQAEMLAALDEPTHTEWGVVNPADTPWRQAMDETADHDALLGLLRAHVEVADPLDHPFEVGCRCGWWSGATTSRDESSREHLADVIEAHYAERLADTWEDGYLAGLHDASQSSDVPVTSNPHRRSNA